MPGSRNRIAVVGVSLLAVAALLALLSVNTFPFVTNDSVVYIDHSRALFDSGFVVDGFRQLGYPVALTTVRLVASSVGAEPLLTMAVVQRLLLVFAGVLAFVYWRWWSLPLLGLLITAGTIAYTNFVLTEGLALPLALLLVFPVVSYLHLVRSGDDFDPKRSLILSGLVVAGALSLYLLRFTYAVFGLAPLILVIASWRTPYRRLSMSMFSVFLVLAGAVTVMCAVENREEFGVMSPSVGGEQTRWYYAWQQVFTQTLENRSDPDLASFFDDGDVLHFPGEIMATDVEYSARSEMYDREIQAMFATAGMSVAGTKLRSTLRALVGGSLHDIGGGVGMAIDSTRFDVDELVYFSGFARNEGPEAFAERYNDSRTPEVVITDHVGVAPPVRDGKLVARTLLPFAIAVLIAGLFAADLRWLAVLGLGVLVATAVGVGWIMADNYRFLVASSGFAVAIATAVASEWNVTRQISSRAG